MSGLFEGKIVAGACGAIGRAALAFAAEVPSVTVSDVDTAAAEATVNAVCSSGGQALAVVGDVPDAAFAQALITRTMTHVGRLDVIFNTTPELSMRVTISGVPRLFGAHVE